MGMPVVNDVFYPSSKDAGGNGGWAATKSLVQGKQNLLNMCFDMFATKNAIAPEVRYQRDCAAKCMLHHPLLIVWVCKSFIGSIHFDRGHRAKHAPVWDCLSFVTLLSTSSFSVGGARPVHASSMPPVLDGLSAVTMDEALLGNELLLFWYWMAVGRLSHAECKAKVSARKSTLEVRQPLMANHMLDKAHAVVLPGVGCHLHYSVDVMALSVAY